MSHRTAAPIVLSPVAMLIVDPGRYPQAISARDEPLK